jgi:hypothetical protein
VSDLFQRVIAVTITDPSIKGLGANAFELTGLRMQFAIKKSLGKEPNTGELTITNLSEQRRAQIRKGGKVSIEAGLGTSWAQIFLGDIRYFEHSREGADWVTKLELGDGERSFKFQRVGSSFPPGTKFATVLRALADATGLDVGNLEQVLPAVRGTYAAGHVVAGNAHLELGRACQAAGLTYSVQDGRLQFLRPGQPNTQTIVILGSESGLVGAPKYGSPPTKGKPRYLSVRSLLNPKLRCGGRVELQAQSHKGLMKIAALTHVGDTHGSDWYTDIECLPL